MALTPKQEHFCRCVASGMTYKDAYKTAYDTKASEQVIANESSKIALRPDIQDRIKTIMKPLQDDAVIQGYNARQERINFILERIQKCIEKDDENSLIRWNEQLNKIYALYKEDNENKQDDNPMESMDLDALKRLTTA